MNFIEARVLLGNLLERVQRMEDGTMRLPGLLTSKEVEALRTLVQGDLPPEPSVGGERVPTPEPPVTAVSLDLSALASRDSTQDVRLCLDFGTAMSKATLVDDRDAGFEDVQVLALGVPGEQQQIDEVMLMSSVYIDNDGFLHFGNAAFEKSLLEGDDGSRQRLDNIKRRLSEDGWDEIVGGIYNPTGVPVTYGTLILAYLTYMTWTVCCCLEELGYDKLTARRFALPCFDGAKGREATERLRDAVGEAQVLADTFGPALRDGVPLKSFVEAVRCLQVEAREYPFVDTHVTEPLGVAGSMISWREDVNSLVLVVDVGAGTSDLGLFRIHVAPGSDTREGYLVEGSTRVLTEAGNYLDGALIEFILKQGNVTTEHVDARRIRGKLNLRIREYKETLFNESSVFVVLENLSQPFEVTVELEEFCELAAVKQFGQSLKDAVVDILESVNESWVGWIKAQPNRHLALMLTGGGANLPMVKDLANRSITVHGDEISVAPALQIPRWLSEGHQNVATDYARVAVSLGGARRRVMRSRSATVTAGDVTAPATIKGYYQKGP